MIPHMRVYLSPSYISPVALSLLVHLVAASSLVAQGRSDVTPPTPRAGDSIMVEYAPPADKRPHRVLAVTFWFHAAEGQISAVQLTGQGSRFSARLAVPDGAAHAAVHFIADGEWDEMATRSFVARTSDGVLPMGAHGRLMRESPRPDSLLVESLRAYPEYVEIYRHRWAVARERGEADWRARISADLASLSSTGPITTDATAVAKGMSAERIYTRFSGHVLLGEFAEAAALLEWLVTEQPGSGYTGRALQRFRFEQHSAGAQTVSEAKLDAWTAAAARRAPNSVLARESLWQFIDDPAWTLDELGKIFEAWLVSEPDHPMPHLFAAQAYLRAGALDRAMQHVRTASSGLLAGQLRRYGDLPGAMTRDRIRQAYDTWSRIALAHGDTALATGLAAAAAGFHTEVHRPELSVHSASLWLEAGLLDQAEEALVEAVVHAGSPAAEGELRELHGRSITRPGSFDSYLQDLITGSDLPETPRFMPAFEAYDLNGAAVGARELAGRVAVLNFWFTTCLPCLVEIPQLNALMRELDDSPVTFTAFALDGVPELESFLATNPFAFSIVPEAASIAEKFGVDAYPMHVLVDPAGRVRLAVKGGEPETLERLRAGITRLLADMPTR